VLAAVTVRKSLREIDLDFMPLAYPLRERPSNLKMLGSGLGQPASEYLN